MKGFFPKWSTPIPTSAIPIHSPTPFIDFIMLRLAFCCPQYRCSWAVSDCEFS